MRLKKIKLAGFKSFVDPTTITLPSSLIGVVGPNGCGKSNVIDAVRWVMGESSAKHLRGESLADVIFNGSNARKPVGHALIELFFDNSKGTLGGEYASYNEISIKRQLSRDGQSNYYLNGTRCRRRDITDIFLGTGLGPRGYSIIEQGTISRLIEAKPEELRVFLEEAAGISKYKERRRETENRIRHTRDNLSRINDLVEELEKRLQVLKRQANAAEKYRELKQEERLLKAQLLALHWDALNKEVTDKEKGIASKETAQEAQMAELRSIEAAIESQREIHLATNETFNQIQGKFYGVGAEIARVEQSIQHANEKRQQNQRDLDEIETAWAEAQRHHENDREQMATLTRSLESSTPEVQQAEHKEQVSAAALHEAEESMHAWQEAWDEFNTRAAAQVQQAEVERTRIQHLEDELVRMRNRLLKLESEQQGLASGTLEQITRTLNEQIQTLGSTIENLQQDMHTLLASISEQRDNNLKLGEELDQEREIHHDLQKQRASLEALQQAALGKQQENVSRWLEEHDMQNVRRLAESIEVENGWERAVENVLGLHLEAICVEGMEAVAAELGSLQKGTLTVFDTHAQASPTKADKAPALASKVTSPWPLTSLLAGVYAVDSLSEALALRSQLDPNETIITRDGIWIGHDWLRVARETDEKAGVLVREQELKLLTEKQADLKSKISALEHTLQEGIIQAKILEEERDTLQASLNEHAHRHAELRAEMGSKNAELEQSRSRHSNLSDEIAEIQLLTETATSELSNARARLEETLSSTEHHEQQRNELTKQRSNLREMLEQSREQARQDRDAAREIALRFESMRTQLESLQDTYQRMESQLSHMARRREELSAGLETSEQPIEAMKQELEQLLAQRLQAEAELASARQKMDECDHDLRELNEQRNTADQKTQEMRNEMEQLRMAWQEIKVRRQTRQEQLDETGFERDTLLQEMPEEANEASWTEQVEKMGQKIQRLGAINLAAIEEYTEQSERKEYLDAQQQDLNAALNTLENAIRKIDHETRTRFKETFEQVNEKLQEFFPRLFGGGVARLEMTGEDLLDAGVNVIARPPGKRNSSIHLLSGGEKALTAVALVFALFELNPSPFCMLDEVDAPLDDSNAARFCQLVKEMSENVQFIFITHNKITMELANQLVGVTMQEAGVSRLVAVDVDEAVELATA